MRIWSLSARGEKKPSMYLHFKRVCVLAGSTARTINSSGEMCLRSRIGHNTQTPQQKKKDDAQPLDFLLHVPRVRFTYGFVQFLSERRCVFPACVEITQENLVEFFRLRDAR